MRVSIWQEFSSNNSARFTVVGVFESGAKAQAAADRLMRLVRDIVAWERETYSTPPGRDWVDAGDGPPSPPEEEAAREYGVEWSEMSLDWVWMDEAGNGPVRAIDNIVFIDGTESWLGSHPADYLVERLGGRALVDGDIDVLGESVSLVGEVSLTLACVASDEATAAAIEDETNTYLRNTDENGLTTFRTPWMSYSPPVGYSTFSGTICRAGQALEFNGKFYHIADGFPAMLEYLRARGCTDIQYSFSEKLIGEDSGDEDGL